MDQPNSSFHNSITTSPRNFGMVPAFSGKQLETLQTQFDSTRYSKAKNNIAVEHLPFPQKFRLNFLRAAMRVALQAIFASTPKRSMSWLHIPRAHCSNFIAQLFVFTPLLLREFPNAHAAFFRLHSTPMRLSRCLKPLCSSKKLPSTNHLITV